MKKTTRIKKVGIFATPENMESHQKFLSKFYNSEGTIAQLSAWTTWNLASELTEAPKDSYNITLTKREVDVLISTLNIGMKCACDKHKKEVIKLYEEFNTIID